jgi:hypothetical protein
VQVESRVFQSPPNAKLQNVIGKATKNKRKTMDIKTKKRIAKEFLLLFSSLLIAAFAFFVIYTYNSYCKRQIESAQISINIKSQKMDSLKLKAHVPLWNETTPISEDELPIFDSVKVKEKESTISKLKDEILSLNNDKQTFQHKFTSTSNPQGLTTNFLLILLFILYPIRLLYFAIKWSIKTVKQ